jgi:hypothetical protein
MHCAVVDLLVGMQCYAVAFILFHDWVPLGTLNNLGGVRAVDSLGKRVWVTLLSALPFGLCLWFSIEYAGAPAYPRWVMIWLWVTYGLGALGALRAWWWPYLGPGDPVRAERYRVRFPETHRFLPTRNGIAPDTLHVALHLVLLGVLALLALA